MSTHTVAETKNQLSKLIDRALKGEHIVVTRRGQPVIEADIEWLRARRARLPRSKVDAGTFVSQMRDEEGER
jgi:antitoxin (DNA-binding transcriptional repressor) of toxin-antitoxin stability system